MCNTAKLTKNGVGLAAEADRVMLETLLAGPVEARLRCNGGNFTLGIPELALTVSGTDLAALFSELAAKREERLRQFSDEGVMHWLQPQGCVAPASNFQRSLKPFFIKTAVVIVLCVGVAVLIGQGIKAVNKDLVTKITAVSSWSPEKVETERQRIKGFSDKLGPVAREFMHMFREGEPATPTTAVDSGK